MYVYVDMYVYAFHSKYDTQLFIQIIIIIIITPITNFQHKMQDYNFVLVALDLGILSFLFFIDYGHDGNPPPEVHICMTIH